MGKEYEDPKQYLAGILWSSEEKEPQEIERLFDRMLEKFPEFLEGKLASGDFLLKIQKPVKAVNVLREAIKIAPENLEAHYLFGVAQQKCGRLHLAFREFELVAKEESNSEIKRQMGWTKVMMGEIKQGRKYLREAINMDLMNSWAYADLGMSYAHSLNFKEALRWMETARSLEKNDYVLWNIKQTKSFQKEFEQFSEKEKRKMRELRKDPREQKLAMIENMFRILQNEESTPQDLEETKKELELTGFNPEMETLRPPETAEQKEVIEYMGYHHKIKDVERKVSAGELKELEQRLFNKDTSLEELKKTLLILAHQGTNQALNLLRNYKKNPHPQLKGWIKLAEEECWVFSKQKPGKAVRIIHQTKKTGD